MITILIAGLGQATFDWLIVMVTAPGPALVGIFGSELGLFVVALALQLAVRRYVAPVYWLAVVGASIFGTLIADVAHFLIGIPLWASPLIFALVVAVNFLLWYSGERSLSSTATGRGGARYLTGSPCFSYSLWAPPWWIW